MTVITNNPDQVINQLIEYVFNGIGERPDPEEFDRLYREDRAFKSAFEKRDQFIKDHIFMWLALQEAGPVVDGSETKE